MIENTDNVQEEIKKIISKIIETEPSRIELDTNFVEDLGADSMMALEIMSALEKKFKIVIHEDELIKIINLRNVMEMVTARLSLSKR